jgi:ribonucleoside-diphosphate reductase alpha chain
MMAAAQPFLSGAISKTINMPEGSTVEDIMQAYLDSWKLGLKAVAIYRDQSKRSQPLSAVGADKEGQKAQSGFGVPEQRDLFARAQRERLPAERRSITHRFEVGGHEGYITVGMYDDGRPGEVFIKMAKEGSTLSGVMDGLALSLSIGLQYGVPLKALADKLINTRFEPSGITPNPEIRFASSLLDYIARWLGGKFISGDYLKLGTETNANAVTSPVAGPPKNSPIHTERPQVSGGDAPSCPTCGMLMVPNGNCYRCANCGNTSGCS